MATIAATAMGIGTKTLTQTTLDGTLDTFSYDPTKRQVLVLRNPTEGAISAVIDGDGGTTVPVGGIGNVSVASGYAVGSIAAGAAVAIQCDAINKYLQGTIAITSGTGLVAVLLTF